MPSGGATSGDRPEPPEEAAGRRAGETRAAGATAPPGPAPAARAPTARPCRSPSAGTSGRGARSPSSGAAARYRVERVLETWVLETGWWRDDGHVSRSYWRVRAGGRVVDLRYDRLSKVVGARAGARMRPDAE